ncbi:MAG: IS21 family transposase [Lachnospiraceae bacterium]|nr:IS21 family transposase [Lachnospiraceae bacterium]
MIIKSNIITDIEIKSKEDLIKLQPLMEAGGMKINKSQIARELGIDRRTVDKYLKGFKKSTSRKRTNCLTDFYDIIEDLLNNSTGQIFYYKSFLWQYLKDNYGYQGSYVNFCLYLKKYSEFDSYFKKRKPSNVKDITIRFETDKGKQAQLDWKEKITFKLKDGNEVIVNVFVLLLSYSRFRVYRLSLSKTQDILFNFLDDAFEVFGGVPKEILTDNMSNVMDEARTKKSSGKINNRFKQFADDYGFEVKPCIAYSPKTKGKVESQMKILDEIRAYNGTLDYDELIKLVEKINNRVNGKVVKGTGRIPVMYFEKEKAHLSPLPRKEIRKPYQINTSRVKVNSSCMVNYKNNQYSVPPEYVDKHVLTQVYDNHLHIYYNTKLIAVHPISEKRLNYLPSHYVEIAKISHAFKEDDIYQKAKENLKLLGRNM